MQQHLDRFDEIADREARAIERLGAGLVFADIPPVAFAAAARAGVPSVAMSNFPWSWIYDGYGHHDAWFARAAASLARAEGEAALLLELEMGGGLDVFPRREPIDPVARRPSTPRSEAREIIASELGLGARRPLVVSSFGGFGDELDLASALARNADFDFLVVSGPPNLALANARSIDPSEGEAERSGAVGPSGGRLHSLSHPDLVAAADCVIGKPGYGTVAECLIRPTPFVHVPRGEFREAEPMVAAIERWLPSAPMAWRDFRAGHFAGAIHAALTSRPRERPSSPRWPDGIEQAARRLHRFLGSN